MTSRPLRTFVSYSHQDETLRQELTNHLALLTRERKIELWHDYRIPPGRDFGKDIGERLNSAELVLLLVSPEFMASDYCFGLEMTRAMERHEEGTATVVPILLRPCDWRTAPFARLNALPRDGRAVTEWPDRDAAFKDIALGLRRVCEAANAVSAPGSRAPAVTDGDVPARELPLRAVARGPLDVPAPGLWGTVARGSPRLERRVHDIVEAADALIAEARTKLPYDRWRQAGAAERVTRQVETLLRDPGAVLSPAEAALAFVVPWVHEAILAAGALLLLRDGDPLDALGAPDAPGGRAWVAYRNFLRSEEALARRHHLLLNRGRARAAEDLASWQLSRFLFASGELWEYVPGGAGASGGWVNDAIDGLFSRAATGDPRVDRLLDGRRLVRLARLMFADAEEIERARDPASPSPLGDDERLGAPPNEWRLSEASFAHLLSMAAGMAADPRRLDGVVAEHLGMSEEMDAPSVTRVFASIAWYPDGPGLQMSLNCPHEAVDLAAQRLLARLGVHRDRLVSTVALDERFRGHIPAHFGDRHVLPERDARGLPRFQRPHLLLELDQGRVLQLLMGRSLYGDPELALRELYQNALDACRIRRARVQCLKARAGGVPDYTGRIVFRAGHDGRTYIECEDNGIGMAERHLRAYFAKAGQRYTDSHEFHVEKAAWSEAGVPFFPNSRFGIGMLSYFMLADELLIQTKRLRPNGEDWERGLRAHIVGGSGLFRLQHTDDVRGGTLLRLYLSEGHDAGEVLRGMLSWLWIPEFEVVLEGPQFRSVLPAGQPTEGLRKAAGPPRPLGVSADRNGHPRLFWFSRGDSAGRDGAMLLADGIRAQPPAGFPARWLVANLSDELQPDLTVDRSKITSCAKGYAYILDRLRAGGWRDLVDVAGWDLLSLQHAFKEWLLPLVLLDRAWRSGPVTGPAEAAASGAGDVRLSLRTLGRQTLGVAPLLDPLILEATPGRALAPEERLGISPTAWAGLLAARTCALHAANVPLPPSLVLLAAFARERGWQDRPTLGLALLSTAGAGLGSVGLTRLLYLAGTWSLTLGEVLELVRPLADVGVELPNLDGLPGDLLPDARLTRLLRETISSGGRRVDAVTPARLLAAGLALGWSLKELEEVIAPLAGVGIALPVAGSAPTLLKLHLKLLSRDLDGVAPWVDRLTVPHLVRATRALSRPLERVVPLAKTLAALGVPLADVDDFLGDPRQQHVLRLCDNRPLTWVVVLQATHELSLPFQEVLGVARMLAAGGLETPDLSSVPADLDLDPRVAKLLSAGRAWPPAMGLGALLEVASKLGVSLSRARELVIPAAALGCTVGGLPPEAAGFCPEERHLQLLSANLDGETLDLSPVPVARLVAASFEWEVPLDDVYRLACPLAVLGVQIPEPKPLVPGFRPTGLHARLLSARLRGKAPWLSSLPLGHLYRASGEPDFSGERLVEALRALMAVGVPAPDWGPVCGEGPAQRVLELLSRDLDADRPWVESVDALHLVRAANRWGAPIGEAEALARRLGVLHASAAHLPEEILHFRPDARHMRLLGGHPDARAKLSGVLAVGDLMSAAVEWGMPLEEVVALARPLVEMGLVAMPDLTAGQLRFPPSERYLLLLSADLDGRPPWVHGMSLAHLQRASERLRQPLSAVVRMARPLSALGLHMPALEALAADDEGRALQILDQLALDQRTVHAWDLAAATARMDAPVTAYTEALRGLSNFGLDVADAAEFVAFAARAQ